MLRSLEGVSASVTFRRFLLWNHSLQMIKLLKCRFHFAGPLDMSRLCITCWDLWTGLALDRNDLSQEALTEWKPIADGCFIPTRQLDVRIVPDAISNVQLEEFQPSQNEILFHYASRSGNDASELLSLTGPSSLRAQRKREVSSHLIFKWIFYLIYLELDCCIMYGSIDICVFIMKCRNCCCCCCCCC